MLDYSSFSLASRATQPSKTGVCSLGAPFVDCYFPSETLDATRGRRFQPFALFTKRGSTNEWTNFLITTAGASAALAGLVIVAVNISSILRYRHLPARAGATIATLILVLVSIAGLIPQSLRAFGIAVLVFGVCCWLLQLPAARQIVLAHRERTRPRRETVRGIVLGQVQTLPFVVAGVMLAASRTDSFYCLGAAGRNPALDRENGDEVKVPGAEGRWSLDGHFPRREVTAG